jgi:hypothetical protein
MPPRKKTPVFRSVLVELPEDRMLVLAKSARAQGLTAHVLAADILIDWLDGKK